MSLSLLKACKHCALNDVSEGTHIAALLHAWKRLLLQDIVASLRRACVCSSEAVSYLRAFMHMIAASAAWSLPVMPYWLLSPHPAESLPVAVLCVAVSLAKLSGSGM